VECFSITSIFYKNVIISNKTLALHTIYKHLLGKKFWELLARKLSLDW
jgi:hypothetical protein